MLGNGGKSNGGKSTVFLNGKKNEQGDWLSYFLQDSGSSRSRGCLKIKIIPNTCCMKEIQGYEIEGNFSFQGLQVSDAASLWLNLHNFPTTQAIEKILTDSKTRVFKLCHHLAL